MIADEWFKKSFEKLLTKGIKKVGYGVPYLTQQKIIKNTVKFYSFVTSILMALFLIYLFTTSVFNRIGYEKTVILVLTIIALRLRK